MEMRIEQCEEEGHVWHYLYGYSELKDTDGDGIPDIYDNCYLDYDLANANTDGDQFCDTKDPNPPCPLDYIDGFAPCSKIFKRTDGSGGKKPAILIETGVNQWGGQVWYSIAGPLQENMFKLGRNCQDYVLTQFRILGTDNPYRFYSTDDDARLYVDVGGSDDQYPRLLRYHGATYSGAHGSITYDDAETNGEKGQTPKYKPKAPKIWCAVRPRTVRPAAGV
eukprot:Clim_evm6s174 gene=Clim_evmTU6s174